MKKKISWNPVKLKRFVAHRNRLRQLNWNFFSYNSNYLCRECKIRFCNTIVLNQFTSMRRATFHRVIRLAGTRFRMTLLQTVFGWRYHGNSFVLSIIWWLFYLFLVSHTFLSEFYWKSKQFQYATMCPVFSFRFNFLPNIISHETQNL